MITEAFTTGVVRLSIYQKQVLAKIIKAETPQAAAADVSYGEKIVAARDQLVDAQFVIYNEIQGTAQLTPQGEQLATSLGLADEMGTLSPDADQAAGTRNESLIAEINAKLL